MGWIITILVGALCGWLASLIMKTDAQQGAIANILIGIVGSILAQAVLDGRSVLFVAEGNHPHAFGLGHSRQVGDGNAGQGEYRVNAVELQRINDKVKPVG